MEITREDLSRKRIDTDILYLDLSKIDSENLKQKILESRIQLLDSIVYMVARKGPATFAEVQNMSMLSKIVRKDLTIAGNIQIIENKELDGVVIVGRRIEGYEDVILKFEVKL